MSHGDRWQPRWNIYEDQIWGTQVLTGGRVPQCCHPLRHNNNIFHSLMGQFSWRYFRKTWALIDLLGDCGWSEGSLAPQGVNNIKLCFMWWEMLMSARSIWFIFQFYRLGLQFSLSIWFTACFSQWLCRWTKQNLGSEEERRGLVMVTLIGHDPSLLAVRSAERDLRTDIKDYKMLGDSWGIILNNRKSRKEISW